MSSPPASSAAAPAAVSDSTLFCQVQDIYSFFKDPVGTSRRNASSSEDLARFNAASALNFAAERGSAACADAWLDLSHAQHELLVDLLLKYYCTSRANPEENAPPISFDRILGQVGFSMDGRQRGVSAHDLDPHKRLDELLRLLVPLYGAPITDREFWAFEPARRDIGKARGLVSRATNDKNRSLAHAQRMLRRAEARLDEPLSTANDARIVRLQQVKAAFSLLHDSASLVPGFDNEAHGVALEVYISRLDPGQQHAAIARVRDFVFAACEERAVRGEALDPNPPLVEILHALHAHDLGHALCAARLNSILHFYMFESGNASASVIKHIQGVVDEFCSEVWTRQFRQLAFSQQLYAVGMVRALLRRIQTLEAPQVVDQLANIFPMNSPSQASWKHAPSVEGPPVALRSLARGTSTRRVPRHADSTASAAPSRYFPQARSARW